VQKSILKQFEGNKDTPKESWETWLIPPMDVLPARIPAELVARVLAFPPDAIPVLIEAKLLHPLGTPTQNAQKFFAKVYIAKLANDLKWLNDATQAVSDYWKKKNERKTVNRAPVALAA